VLFAPLRPAIFDSDCSTFDPAQLMQPLHKSTAALKSDADGKALVAKMKELPTADKLFGKGTVRADGRKLHPMYLVG
jgi:hypothetical protein